MSLFGVNFRNQLVGGTDHAALFAGILPDGILRGCAMSAAGSTLTLGAGYLIAAGRLIGNDAALNIPVSGSSGVARAVLVIDLSAAATAETFEQATIRVDTAESVGALPVLTQEDINGSGTIYELALCTMVLGSTGGTSVTDKLGTACRVIRFGTATPTAATLPEGEIYIKL